MAEAIVEAAAPEEPEKKRGLVVTLMVAVFALGGGAALGVFGVGPMVAPQLAQAGTGEAASDSAGTAENDGATGDRAAAAPVNLFTLDNFIVNPAGTDGTRFLMMSLAIEVSDPALVETLTLRDAEVRDALVRTVGVKTVQELADLALRDVLVTDMSTALDGILGAGSIQRIFMPQFVIQ